MTSDENRVKILDSVSFMTQKTLKADQSPVTLLVTDKDEILLGYSDQ